MSQVVKRKRKDAYQYNPNAKKRVKHDGYLWKYRFLDMNWNNLVCKPINTNHPLLWLGVNPIPPRFVPFWYFTNIDWDKLRSNPVQQWNSETDQVDYLFDRLFKAFIESSGYYKALSLQKTTGIQKKRRRLQVCSNYTGDKYTLADCWVSCN